MLLSVTAIWNSVRCRLSTASKSALATANSGQPLLSGGNYVTGFSSMKRIMGIGNAL